MTDAEPTDADHIRHEIEETRADLAATVDALSAKLDVKSQASAKASDVKAAVVQTAAKAKDSAPPVVQKSLDRAGTALAPAAAHAKPYRTQILAGVGVAAVIAILARRKAGRSQ